MTSTRIWLAHSDPGVPARRDTFAGVATERQKMLAGEMYDPLDPELAAARARARDLCQQLNATRDAQDAQRRRILRDLFGTGGDTVWMQPPFYCDYGTNIELGERARSNGAARNLESRSTSDPTCGWAAARSSRLASASGHEP